MAEFIIHGVPGSPFLRAAHMTLEEKGADYELRPLAPGGHRTEAYRALNPFMRIPVLQHGEITVYETQAIIRYLDGALAGASLIPEDLLASTRMTQLIGINDWYLFPKVSATIGFHRIVGPLLMGIPGDEAAIAAAVPDAEHILGVIAAFLGERDYLVGNQLTLADLMIYPHLFMLLQTPEGRKIMSGAPLEVWVNRMTARPSAIASQPPEALRVSV